MSSDPPPHLQKCPLEFPVKIIGGRWRSIVIYILAGGPKRFSDLEKNIPSISQRMLTLDLKKLEKAGIISRSILAESPVKVEYRLTPVGTELGQIVHQLAGFGNKIFELQSSGG